MEAVTALLLRSRYAVLALAAFALVALHAAHGQWLGDFWEHAAVVRELATYPLAPAHPILRTGAPHAFYSPYTLLLGCVSRLTGLSDISTLAVAGMANYWILVLALRWFIGLLMPRLRESAPFYALLFLLLAWGPHPWYVSGFTHLGVLGYVLPYPSTFATALALLVFGAYVRYLQRGRWPWLAAVAAGAAVVGVTHPLSFILLGGGLAALCLGSPGARVSSLAALAGALAVALLLCALWPYYPFMKLMWSDASVYDPANRKMYEGALRRLFPALIGIVPAALRLRKERRDPLALMLALLSLFYVWGWLSGRWTYGRSVAHVALTLHILLGWGAAEIETRIRWPRTPEPVRRLLFCGAVVALALAWSFSEFVRPAVERARPGTPNTYRSFAFLSRHTGQYDVVLSDLLTSWTVPALGGKVVAWQHPLAFVPDDEQRRRDVQRFLGDAATRGDRLAVIRKYRVAFLLLNKSESPRWREVLDSLSPDVAARYEDAAFVLARISTIQH